MNLDAHGKRDFRPKRESHEVEPAAGSYEEYYPYGSTAWRAPELATISRKRYRFTGMERDEESGLQCHGRRYYTPWLGRWTSADPIGLGDGVNRFEYCHGNPVGGRDPSGLLDWAHPIDSAAELAMNSPQAWALAGMLESVNQIANAPTSAADQAQATTRDPVMVVLDTVGFGSLSKEAAGLARLAAAEPVAAAVRSLARGLDFAEGVGDAVTQGAREGVELLTPKFKLPEVSSGAAGARPTSISITAPEMAVGTASRGAATYGELRAAGIKDAHHVIQDAAVRDLPGYRRNAAPAVHLDGPSTRVGSPHYEATQVQRQAGGGTYAAERRIGYKSMRAGGLTPAEARAQIEVADAYFESIGVGAETVTRVPGNR